MALFPLSLFSHVFPLFHLFFTLLSSSFSITPILSLLSQKLQVSSSSLLLRAVDHHSATVRSPLGVGGRPRAPAATLYPFSLVFHVRAVVLRREPRLPPFHRRVSAARRGRGWPRTQLASLCTSPASFHVWFAAPPCRVVRRRGRSSFPATVGHEWRRRPQIRTPLDLLSPLVHLVSVLAAVAPPPSLSPPRRCHFAAAPLFLDFVFLGADMGVACTHCKVSEESEVCMSCCFQSCCFRRTPP